MTATSPRPGNRVVVAIVLPFYLVWTLIAHVADVAVAAVSRGLRKLATALTSAARVIIRAIRDVLTPIGRLLQATVGRAIVWLWKAVSTAVAELVAWLAPVLRRLVAVIGRLIRLAWQLAVRVLRPFLAVPAAILVVVGTWTGRLFDILAVPLRSLGRRIAAVVAAALRTAVRVVEKVASFTARLVRPLVAAIRSAVVSIRRLLVAVRRLLSPLFRQLVAAWAWTAGLVRAVLAVFRPIATAWSAARREVARVVRTTFGRPEPAVAVPRAADAARPGSEGEAVARVAATAAVFMLAVAVVGPLLSGSDDGLALMFMLAGMFLAGALHPRASILVALIGLALGTAIAIGFAMGVDLLLSGSTTIDFVPAWIGTTIFASVTFLPGRWVGRLQSHPATA